MMAFEKNPDRHDREAEIQKKQQEIDAYDEKLDAKVSVSPEETEVLTNTYFGKVNKCQGYIKGLRGKIEVAKDMKANNWSELEDKCNETEEGLSKMLDKINYENVISKRADVDVAIDTLIESLATAKGRESVKEGVEKRVTRSGADILKELGLPAEKSMEAKLENLTPEQEEKIRAVHTNLKFLERIPAEMHELIFKTLPVSVSGDNPQTEDIAELLLDDRLEGSQYAYLLNNPELPVIKVREKALDRRQRIQDKVDGLRNMEANLMNGICKETGNFEYNLLDVFTDKIEHQSEIVQRGIDRIKQLRPQIAAAESELTPVNALLIKLDLALGAHAAYENKNEGREEEGNRTLMKLWETHGSAIREMDGGLWKEMGRASGELRRNGQLTDFEEVFYSNKKSSAEKLDAAIENKKMVSGTADIIDQVRSKVTLRVSDVRPVSDKWKEMPKLIHSGSGELMSQNHLKNYFIANINFLHSGNKTVLLSPDAKKALDNIPEGAQPLVLRRIGSVNTKMHGYPAKEIFTAPPYNFTLQASDIGYKEGNLAFNNNGERVYTTLEEDVKPRDGEFIDKQINNERGFGVNLYITPDKLQYPGGKYPGKFYTVDTAAGKIIEGVKIDIQAKQMMDKDPPQGMTLVLKRVPKDIQLSVPTYTHRVTKQNTRNVLSVDTIKAGDLAYARIDGDEIVMKDAKGYGSEKRENIYESEKTRYEKSRDVLRAMARDPAINNMKRASAGIQRTVTNLQQFLTAANDGSARQNFIDFVHEEVKPMHDFFNNPKPKADLENARQQLHQLKTKAGSGVALGGIEHEIDAQINAIDSFINMIDSPDTKNLLDSLTDESNFNADNWKNWLKNDLPVIVAALLVACAAAVTVTMTCGVAAPMWAVAAAGAAGGILGRELGKEVVHKGHQLLDSDPNDRFSYRDRSLYMKALNREKVFNYETGQYETVEVLDMGHQYGKEFERSFVITYCTLGLGQLAGTGISKVLQNPKIMQYLSKHDTFKLVTRILARMNKNPEALARSARARDAIKHFVRETGKETGDEVLDELQEGFWDKALTSLAVSLTNAENEEESFVREGGVGAVIVATFKCIKLSKGKTNVYPISGDINIDSIAEHANRIKNMAEANGAIVHDFGKGFIAVDEEIMGPDGKPTGKYDRTMFMPPNGKELDSAIDQKIEQERTETLEKAKQIDGLQDIDFDSDLADVLFAAHRVLPSGVRPDGTKYYTSQDIAQKARIVKVAQDKELDSNKSLTDEQRAERKAENKRIREKLIRRGVLGERSAMVKDPVDTDEASLAGTVRSNITKAFGGEPNGEFTTDFLTQRANLTQSELQRAIDAGILVKGKHHWVLADRQNASNPKVGPRKNVEVHVSLKNASLLDQLSHRSYTEIRAELEKYNYLDLFHAKSAFDKKADEMNSAWKKSPLKTRTIPPTEHDIFEELFAAVKQPSLKGELDKKHTAPDKTKSSGYHLSYNGGLEGGPCTSIWINPHYESLRETVRLIDDCLANCKAGVKVHVDEIASKPEANSEDKLVVYFNVDNHADITKFLRALNARQGELDGLLFAEQYEALMRAYRISLRPGVSFVERPSQSSWDTKLQYINPEQRKYNALISQWKKTGNVPTAEECMPAFRIDPMERNEQMPALKADPKQVANLKAQKLALFRDNLKPLSNSEKDRMRRVRFSIQILKYSDGKMLKDTSTRFSLPNPAMGHRDRILAAYDTSDVEEKRKILTEDRNADGSIKRGSLTDEAVDILIKMGAI